MGNWYGTCRSNYFKVKDKAAFVKFLNDHEAELIEDTSSSGEDLFGFYSITGDGGMPSAHIEDNEHETFITKTIHTHLVEGEVCVVLVVGAEKQRYITGEAIAINSDGKQIELDLNHIYDLAKDQFENTNITKAEY